MTPQPHVSQASRRCLSDERSPICMFLLYVESQSVQVVYRVAGRMNACLLLCVPVAENNILSFAIGCMTSRPSSSWTTGTRTSHMRWFHSDPAMRSSSCLGAIKTVCAVLCVTCNKHRPKHSSCTREDRDF